MRIALFTDSFYPELGGIQDSIAVTSRALGERGHAVRVFAPAAARSDYALAGVPATEVDLGANVGVRRLFSVPLPSSTRQSRLLLPTGRRWREVAAFRPDILHTHTFLGAGVEAIRAAQRLRLPLVGTNHWAIGAFGVYSPFAAALVARTGVRAVTGYYNRCDFVTGPSRSVLDEMQAHGLRKPHAVVSNPIDTGLFRPPLAGEKPHLKRRLGFSDATILYAGRLAIEKNVDVLIRALARLKDAVPGVMLALAGHGAARRGLERLAGEAGVAQRVRFLGTLDQAQLASAYRAADVFAIASTSETQSMVLLQAMSAGLPAVGARWRALPEYIPRAAGLLAEPGDAGDFAANLATLLTAPLLRARMSERASGFAQGFSVPSVVRAWERVYASTLAGSVAASAARPPHCNETAQGMP